MQDGTNPCGEQPLATFGEQPLATFGEQPLATFGEQLLQQPSASYSQE